MSKKLKLVPLLTAMQTLMLDQKTMDTLVDKKEIEIYKNSRNNACILKSDLKRLCNNEEVRNFSKECLLNSIKLYDLNNTNGGKALYIQKINELIKQYRNDISVLEKIHYKYRNNLNILKDETALVAAYILYAKVINLLNMACLCLENYYFHTGLLLRIIDETVDVATYFIISEGGENDSKNLRIWFREDVSPKHKICREVISKYLNSINMKIAVNDHEDLINEIYQKKSKMIHPTRNTILEVIKFSSEDKRSLPNSFDYKSCSYTKKIYQLTDFFKSSVWTAIQGFYICFYKKMPLKKDDMDILIKLNDKYEKSS